MLRWFFVLTYSCRPILASLIGPLFGNKSHVRINYIATGICFQYRLGRLRKLPLVQTIASEQSVKQPLGDLASRDS